MNALERIAQRFPLVARPRPACLSLTARIAELRDLADTAAMGTKAAHLTVAAEVLNKAALVASDCGVTALARSLCWRHFAAYLPAWPLDATQARHALEPLVNLARLAIRERDGARGYLLLRTLFQTVSDGGTADINGHRVPFDGLARSANDLHTVRKWLWGIFLAEGIRALISAGQWDQAAAHAQQYRGIGQRLLDGRQATIVAHCLAGRTDDAQKLVADSAPEQPWEHLVAECLDALCSRAIGLSPGSTDAHLQRQLLELDRAPGLLVFRTRLGLTILDLTTETDGPLADCMFTFLIGDIIATADGYAAREVLTHERTRALLSLAEQRELSSAVQNAGLGLGTIPTPLISDLFSAVKTSETVIAAGLNVPAESIKGHAST
ncbi:hypothetical protein Aple_025180 [Acrocarpospora pleiomorpha]|uniref:Uncharacterized protein n=1 Tax=Acrocarpospora pleiomorpha TaxID=90975 RepID=A0A5M3XFW3_9ACTN|nr:hypothetical protein [Acrocarpospora pleiomorpha]GES19622.1 hypothetical protein Aple_025180 [Acrocarpospora pleiomorpha]